MEAMNRCPKVPITEVNTVLKMYRENGTHEVFISPNRSLKLVKVGFIT